ncbi:MAG: hypothetical protein ACK5PP_11835 [Acidimicrobiales bacterium]
MFGSSVDTTLRPPTNRPGPGAGAATARALVEVLAVRDLDELDRHRLDLAVAVAELSAAAGRDWSWGPDEPTVALVRAAAKLALVAPRAASTQAARLVRTLDEPTPTGPEGRDGRRRPGSNGLGLRHRRR